MKSRELSTTLNELIGHLAIQTPEEKKKFNQLERFLSRSVIEEKPCEPRQPRFSFEKSDLFSEDKISDDQKSAIHAIVNNREEEKRETKYKVYRREVPIREKLLPNSVADWAIGSKVDRTLGPFNSIDGRKFWYDFYPIEKLIALYMQGVPDPVLLFKIKQSSGRSYSVESVLTANPSKTYALVKGSIWIHSKFLAPNAPAGTYTGLTINGGKITLSDKPQDINNKLTVSANTTVKVQLKLNQQKVSDADNDSPYGIDARKMQLQLPETFEFHFSGNGRTIDEAGGADWELYGQNLEFEWLKNQQVVYDAQIQRIFFPYKASEESIEIQSNESDFNFLSNKADIQKSGWALPVANIDISQPTAADGIGEIFMQCKEGLTNKWIGLNGGFFLKTPGFLVSPGQILIADQTAGNSHSSQSLKLWKDEQNELGTNVNLTFLDNTTFFYVSNANGNELLMTFCNADFQIDRPVKVNGMPPAVSSLNSLLLIAVNQSNKLIYLYDDNLILDDAQINNEDPIIPKQMALALTNALFKVTQPNGCLLFGSLNDDFSKVEKGFLFLTFGLLAYIPTLPDPYAANLGIMQRQIRGSAIGSTTSAGGSAVSNQQISAWLVCRIAWDVTSDESDNHDQVDVSFHFAPLNNQFAGISFEEPEEEEPEESSSSFPIASSGHSNVNLSSVEGTVTDINNPVSRLSALNFSNTLNGGVEKSTSAGEGDSEEDFTTEDMKRVAFAATHSKRLPDYEAQWEKDTFRYKRDLFALLDVSTNADLFGISFDLLTRRDFRVATTTDAVTGETTASFFPVQADGMDVVSTGANVKAFTVPQISWEPVFNLSPPAPPPDGPIAGDPAGGFNYYPNDGGPTHILNNSNEQVVLAPLPVTGFLLDKRETDSDFKAFSFFTLPFGMKAVALLSDKYIYNNVPRDGGDLKDVKVDFDNDVQSGLQLRMDAGIPLREGDSNMFMGTTVQLNNILDLTGNASGNSTLGGSVTSIFNREFFYDSNYSFELFKQRGVPVTRMDLSGYGASMFSNWLNTKAAIF